MLWYIFTIHNSEFLNRLLEERLKQPDNRNSLDVWKNLLLSYDIKINPPKLLKLVYEINQTPFKDLNISIDALK